MHSLHTLVRVAAALSLLALSASPSTAQTGQSASPKKLVSLKLNFVLLKQDDLDAWGLNFGLVRLPAVEETGTAPQKPLYLEYATGYPVTLLYQRLSQVTPISKITLRTFSVPPVTTSDNVPAAISVDEEVPDLSDVTMATDTSSYLPQVNRVLKVHGGLVLIPRINTDHSITLSISLPPDPTVSQTRPGSLIRLWAIASGATLVLGGTVTPQPPSFTLSIKSISTDKLKHSFSWVLLTFITPTLVNN